MKKKFLRAMLAVVCVVAAGFGSWKAYSAYEMYEARADLLLVENIEAMSFNEDNRKFTVKKCYMSEDEKGNANCYICPEGTESKIVLDCPQETKKLILIAKVHFVSKKWENKKSYVYFKYHTMI